MPERKKLSPAQTENPYTRFSLSALSDILREKTPWVASNLTSYCIHPCAYNRNQADKDIQELRSLLDAIETKYEMSKGIIGNNATQP